MVRYATVTHPTVIRRCVSPNLSDLRFFSCPQQDVFALGESILPTQLSIMIIIIILGKQGSHACA